VFVYNARTPAFESSSLAALYAVIEIIGHSIKRIQSRGFEIRFTHAINMKFSSFRHLAKCFALMHQHGLRPVMKDRIIKTTTAGNSAEADAPIRAITVHLFTLGLRLAGKRCKCKIHAKDKDVKAYECDSQVRYELKRLIFCKEARGEYFMRREIIEFLSKIGLRRPQVCIHGTIPLSFVRKCWPKFAQACNLPGWLLFGAPNGFDMMDLRILLGRSDFIVYF
jgi:hypothetical protein